MYLKYKNKYFYMFSKIIKLATAASMFAVLTFAGISPVTFAEDAPTSGLGVKPLGLPDVCISSNGGKCAIVCNFKSLNTTQEIVGVILRIAQFLTAIAVALAVLAIVYGGFKYMNPTDAKGAESGKTILVNAAIGLAIAILAGTIVTLVKGAVSGSYF